MAVEMILCKWCRKGIEKTWRTSNDEILAPWIHLSGQYSCATEQSREAAPADTRWEYVHAEIEPDPTFEATWFKIQMLADGWLITNVKKFPNADIKGKSYDVTKDILDEMVIEIDDELLLNGSVREYLYYGRTNT